MDFNKYNKLVDLVEDKLDKGKYAEALSLTLKLCKMGKDNPLIITNSCAFLINIGTCTSDNKLIKRAIREIEENLEELLRVQESASYVYYNLANGYYSLFKSKVQINPLTAYFSYTDLNKARDLYLKALDHNPSDKKLASQIWTSLGNCFDSSGRVVDAIECYERALYLYPDHGMALGNKGIAYYYYAQLAGDHEVTFLHEAYCLLSKAFEEGVTYESKNYFESYLNSIKNLFSDSKFLDKQPNFPGYKIDSRSEIEKFLIKFCIDNKLYLNLCNACQKCDAAIGDTIGIKSMIISSKKISVKRNPFLRLTSYLNQIKEDYVTARFLLTLSKFKGINLDFVDKRVSIINTFDSSIYSVYIQMIKISFKSFYDILDKISIFINDYLKLGKDESKVNIRNIWYSDLKTKKIYEKIKEIKNFSLNALYDTSQELENGRYEKLRHTRNALTHRFVNIKISLDKEDERNMYKDTLYEQTLELAKIVRNSIIYLMHFVLIEENNKRKKIAKKLPKIRALEIPHELRSLR